MKVASMKTNKAEMKSKEDSEFTEGWAAVEPPRAKLQHPEKIQIPNPSQLRLHRPPVIAWCLKLFWMLELGRWMFPFI
jgi:hypothetical protein